MERALVLKKDILEALEKVGVAQGQTIMVHTSLSKLGFVCGGAQIVIEALLESVGENGTIMMPTQSWKNLDPTAGVHWEEPEEWWQVIRDNWPAYDKDITPTNTMGAVAEMFRKWNGTLRSNHPARSVAANGKNAKYLTENHDLSNIFGDGSPIGKLYELDGYVLLIGVGYDKNTSLHLADERAKYPGKHLSEESSAILVDGKREWKTYRTLYVDGEDFEEIGEAFEKERKVAKVPLGNAELIFMKQRELVDFAVDWIEKNRKEKKSMEKLEVNGVDYEIIKLLGKGKGGYSYLATDGKKNYVLKQIHHEPCDYYNFGNKIEAEKNDYERLKKTGIRMPQMLAIDEEKERILKEYIDGPTIYQLVMEDKMEEKYLKQIKEMCEVLYPLGINIDYFPTNFVVQDEKIYYIDYECNNYMEEWNFENWGVKYWSQTEDFLKYVEEHK